MKIDAFAIKKLMAAYGYNTTKLAELAGMSRQSVSTILSRGSCSIVNVGKLARALGVEVEDIAKKED